MNLNINLSQEQLSTLAKKLNISEEELKKQAKAKENPEEETVVAPGSVGVNDTEGSLQALDSMALMNAMLVNNKADEKDGTTYTFTSTRRTQTIVVNGESISVTATVSGNSKIKVIVGKDGKINIYNNGGGSISFANAKQDLNINVEKSTAAFSVIGGKGNDAITVQEGAKINIINGGEGNDIIVNNGENNSNAKIIGNAGNDMIFNNSQVNSIDGSSGNDNIFNLQSAKATMLTGDAGNDNIVNFGTTTKIAGGAGNDRLDNFGTATQIQGGAGTDTIGAKNGATASGVEKYDNGVQANGKYYKNGELATGEADGKYYVDGELANGVYNNFTYVNGKINQVKIGNILIAGGEIQQNQDDSFTVSGKATRGSHEDEEYSLKVKIDGDKVIVTFANGRTVKLDSSKSFNGVKIGVNGGIEEYSFIDEENHSVVRYNVFGEKESGIADMLDLIIHTECSEFSLRDYGLIKSQYLNGQMSLDELNEIVVAAKNNAADFEDLISQLPQNVQTACRNLYNEFKAQTGNNLSGFIDGVLYINGEPANGLIDDRYYQNGVPATGVINFTLYINGYRRPCPSGFSANLLTDENNNITGVNVERGDTVFSYDLTGKLNSIKIGNKEINCPESATLSMKTDNRDRFIGFNLTSDDGNVTITYDNIGDIASMQLGDNNIHIPANFLVNIQTDENNNITGVNVESGDTVLSYDLTGKLNSIKIGDKEVICPEGSTLSTETDNKDCFIGFNLTSDDGNVTCRYDLNIELISIKLENNEIQIPVFGTIEINRNDDDSISDVRILEETISSEGKRVLKQKTYTPEGKLLQSIDYKYKGAPNTPEGTEKEGFENVVFYNKEGQPLTSTTGVLNLNQLSKIIETYNTQLKTNNSFLDFDAQTGNYTITSHDGSTSTNYSASGEIISVLNPSESLPELYEILNKFDVSLFEEGEQVARVCVNEDYKIFITSLGKEIKVNTANPQEPPTIAFNLTNLDIKEITIEGITYNLQLVNDEINQTSYNENNSTNATGMYVLPNHLMYSIHSKPFHILNPNERNKSYSTHERIEIKLGQNRLDVTGNNICFEITAIEEDKMPQTINFNGCYSIIKTFNDSLSEKQYNDVVNVTGWGNHISVFGGDDKITSNAQTIIDLWSDIYGPENAYLGSGNDYDLGTGDDEVYTLGMEMHPGYAFSESYNFLNNKINTGTKTIYSFYGDKAFELIGVNTIETNTLSEDGKRTSIYTKLYQNGKQIITQKTFEDYNIQTGGVNMTIDSEGNVTEKIEYTFTRDDLGRIIKKHYVYSWPNEQETYPQIKEYEYDTNGNILHYLDKQEPFYEYELTFEYDEEGLVSNLTRRINDKTEVIEAAKNLTPRLALEVYINNKCEISDNMKNDIQIVNNAQIEALQAGEEGSDAYQRAYNDAIKAQMIKTPQNATGTVGEVVEKSDGLYVTNEEGQLVKLNISADTYLELFPPMRRFDNAQNTIGDCYFVSACLVDMIKSPTAFSNLLQMFSEDDNGNLTVQFTGTLSDYSVTFPRNEQGNLVLRTLDTNDGTIGVTYDEGHHVVPYTQVTGAIGVQILEQAFAIAKFANTINQSVDLVDIDNAIASIVSGLQSDIYREILGANSVWYADISQSRQNLWLQIGEIEESDILPVDTLDLIRGLADELSNNDILFSIGFYSENSQYDIVAGHAYSIDKIDLENEMIYIINPWHTGGVTAVPFDIFDNLDKGFNICTLDGSEVNLDELLA